MIHFILISVQVCCFWFQFPTCVKMIAKALNALQAQPKNILNCAFNDILFIEALEYVLDWFCKFQLFSEWPHTAYCRASKKKNVHPKATPVFSHTRSQEPEITTCAIFPPLTTWTSDGTLERKSSSSLLSIMYGLRSFLVNLFTPAGMKGWCQLPWARCPIAGVKSRAHPTPAQGIAAVWGRAELWPNIRQWSPASSGKAPSS